MEEFQLDVKNDMQGAIERLDFRGEMVLSNMESLLGEMSLLNFDSSQNVRISLKEVVELDLSFLQLFKSFVFMLQKRQLSVVVEWPEDNSLVGLLERSGFKSVLNMN